MKLSYLLLMVCCLVSKAGVAQRKLVVDQQGKGDYTTLQAALDALPSIVINP